MELRNVQLRAQIKLLNHEVRDCREKFTAEKEIVTEQNEIVKNLKDQLRNLMRKSSGYEEECVSLLSEKESLVQCLAETTLKLNHLEQRGMDQDDTILYYQQELKALQFSRDFLFREAAKKG